MMYDEFIKGTGCKENAHNYKVFCDLEVMYMHSSLSKEDIYEYGRKLVDNSKTPEELELEEKIKSEIEGYKKEIVKYKEWIEENERFMCYWKDEGDKEMVAFYRNLIKGWKKEICRCKALINSLKFILS